MKKADLITGFVLLVLSGYVIWNSWRMPSSATFGPGSGFLPFWLGVLDVGVGNAYFVFKCLAPGRRIRRRDPRFQAGSALFREFVMVGLAVYISLMEVLGFL